MDSDIQELKKALDTSTTNGNNVLDPVLLSKIITEQARKKSAIRNIIPRVPFPGKVYTWDTEVTPGDAATAADGANISLTDASFVQNQAAMSYFYQVGYITNPAILAAQELVDAVALRVGGATKAVLRKEGAAIIQGDAGNSQNPGLLAALKASNTYGIAGDGATLSRSLMTSMETDLADQGYEIDAWVVSKGIYAMLKEAAFNNVRFLGIQDGGAIGFPILGASALAFNGKPVILDPYAGVVTAVSGETLGTVTGNTKAFTFAHQPVNPMGQANYTDQAGTALPAPVIKVGGSVQASGYSIAGSTVTFTSAPSGAVTADYSYKNENAFALSLNPADLVIAEMLGLTVDKDLANPVQQDSVPFRVKEYCVTAVRNPLAHAVATNIVLPASYTDF